MKGGKSPLGYTIIEVMIVLAVSGMMLAIAGTFINGKQPKTSFTSGVNELASRIQDTINQVTDGQYSDIPLNCVTVPGGINVSLGSASDIQGTNSDCFFLGKIMHFQYDGQNNQYEVISMAGRRLTAAGVPVSNVTQATPEPIEDLTITQTVPQNLDVEWVRFTTGATTITNTGLAFVQTIVAGGEAAQGAQTPPKLHFAAGMANQGHPGSYTAAKALNNLPADSARLCVTDGTRSAFITVGINNSQQSAIVTMRGNVPC